MARIFLGGEGRGGVPSLYIRYIAYPYFMLTPDRMGEEKGKQGAGNLKFKTK